MAAPHPALAASGGRPLLRTALAALKLAAFGHVMLQHVASPGLPFGPSMLPAFEISQECILVSHAHRHGRGVRVGDVVVYAIPTDAANNGVKRVLGLEGDYVLKETPGGVEGAAGGSAMIQVRVELPGCSRDGGWICSPRSQPYAVPAGE